MYKRYKALTDHLMDYEFDQLKEFVERMTISLKREQNRFEDWFEAETKDLSEDEGNRMAEWHSDTFCQLAESFPRLFSQGAVVTIWSFFENQMVSICRDDIKHEAKLEENREAIADDIRDVNGCKKHLKMRGVTLPLEWRELDQIRDVRNQIAHDNGRRYFSRQERHAESKTKTQMRSEKVDRYVEARLNANRPGLSFKSETLVVEPEFCTELVDLCRNFLKELIRLIPDSNDEDRERKFAMRRLGEQQN